ncbi:hypothetical protein [Mucilaginibacter sp.]|uniref:hypothetical protein n=1 Tax=Mucilaginibacter sp. TaxID=1882438 RepID=UPI002ED20C11
MNDATYFQTDSTKSDQSRVGQKEYNKKEKVTFKVEKAMPAILLLPKLTEGWRRYR